MSSTSSRPEPKLRVAIIGAGVGGLTLAYALSKADDIRIDVYEAASQLAEIGAGIGLFWRSQRILTDLGLKDAVTGLGSEFRDGYVPAFRCRKSDQVDGEDIQQMVVKGGLTAVHRAEFYDVLVQKLALTSQYTTHTSKRLVSYASASTDDPITLSFADGTTAEADVVIGSDGLRSATRANMYELLAAETGNASLRDHISARFSGLISYRTVIPREKLAALNPNHRALCGPVQYLGKNKHMIAYPISKGRLVNLAMFECRFDQEDTEYQGPWMTKADPAEVAKMFEGWESDVADLMKAIQELNVGSWVINVVKPLPTFVHGRVALLGDAAHAMAPLQGAGAGQAIEDASVLAPLLRNPSTTRTSVARALSIYSQIRMPAAKIVVDMSRENSYLSAFHTPGEEDVSLPELGERMQRCWEMTHGRNDPLEDVRRGLETLEKGVDA